MGRYEKIAWFNIVVVTLAVATYILVTFLLASRMSITVAAASAVASFALMGFIGFAPRLFGRQDIDFERSSSSSPAHRNHTGITIVFCVLIVAIIVAIIKLYTVLLGLPEGNTPVFAVSAALLTVLPVMLGGLLLMGILLFLNHRTIRPSTETTDRSTMRYGLFADTDMDERDLAIHNRALKAGFGAFFGTYLSMFIGTFIFMLSAGKETLTIDIQLMLVPMWLPFIVIVAVASITKIVLYRRGGTS